MSELSLTTPPSTPPIDTATAKLWLRIDQSDEDAAVDALVAAARDQVEADTGYRFGAQTWTWRIDQRWVTPTVERAVQRDLLGVIEYDEWERPLMWPGYEQKVESPLRPLTAVTAISYRLGGADVAYDVANLRLAGSDIIFPAAHPFPLSDERYASVTLTLDVGYTTVPDWALQAMRFLIVHWYEERVPVMMGRSGMGIQLPLTYQAVIGSHRRVSIV